LYLEDRLAGAEPGVPLGVHACGIGQPRDGTVMSES